MSNIINFPDAQGRQEASLKNKLLFQKKELEGLNKALDGLYELLAECKALGQENDRRRDS